MVQKVHTVCVSSVHLIFKKKRKENVAVFQDLIRQPKGQLENVQNADKRTMGDCPVSILWFEARRVAQMFSATFVQRDHFKPK